jgi:DNA-binding Lrp family transcriptional regulator
MVALKLGKRSSRRDKMERLLFEYLKDSNRSDRKIAKILGVSQPTVSRLRGRLVYEGFVKGFSAIPDLGKMGYEIMAISCAKFKTGTSLELEEKAIRWFTNHPNIIFASKAQGMGMNAVMVSLHKNFADYAQFSEKAWLVWSDYLEKDSSMLIDLQGQVIRPLSFKYLAEQKRPAEEADFT